MRTIKIAPASKKTQEEKMRRHPGRLVVCAQCSRSSVTLIKVPTIGKPESEWPYYCPLCLSNLGHAQ